MKTLADRLKWARERAGISQEELGRLAGLSQGGIGHLENQHRTGSRRLPQIAQALRVNALWLAEGVGHPDANVTQTVVVRNESPRVELVYADIEEMRLLTLYREADDTGKQLIRTIAENAPKADLASRNKA